MLQEIIKAWLIPPALNTILFVIGLVILRWHKTTGRLLIAVSVISLALVSTDYVASKLENSILAHPALVLEELPASKPLTIVVAGSSHHRRAIEYGHPTPTSVSLKRLHYTAYLHRKTGYPVLLTGGLMNENQIHADVLAQSLIEEFKTEVRWREIKSRSTDENAQFSAEILLPQKRNTILLVTHSYHMKRAVRSFEKVGFTVIPAPTVMPGKLGIDNWRYWVPGPTGLQRSTDVIYEYFGLARDWLTSAFAEQDDCNKPCANTTLSTTAG